MRVDVHLGGNLRLLQREEVGQRVADIVDRIVLGGAGHGCAWMPAIGISNAQMKMPKNLASVSLAHFFARVLQAKLHWSVRPGQFAD